VVVTGKGKKLNVKIELGHAKCSSVVVVINAVCGLMYNIPCYLPRNSAKVSHKKTA